MDKDNFWILYCESPENKEKWMNDIRDVLETYQLNEIIESSIKMNEGFQILSATYGILDSRTKSKDVTEVLKNIVKNQGGNQLVLYSEPKSIIFGNPAERRRKKLEIVFSNNGAIKKRIYNDNDPVTLPD